MATFSSLQNINWLNKNVRAVYKEKNVYCPSLIPSPYNVFLYFWDEQGHKDSKLRIITVGKNRLVKVILKNIHKISDACVSSFGRYIMNAQYMRNVFTLLNSNSIFLRKLKHSSIPQHYSNCSTPPF